MKKTLILIFILAAGLRFAGITYDSFWLDEGYQTVSESMGATLPNFTEVKNSPYLFQSGPIQSIPNLLHTFRTIDPLCPPLYAVCLNRWMLLFGTSDFAIRALSACLSLLTLAMVYLITCFAFGKKPAQIAALVQAFSSFDIYYAQEARMYTLETFLATLSCGSLLYIFNYAPANKLKLFIVFLIYIASTWAVINTHYTALFLLAAQVLITIIFCIKQKRHILFCQFIVAWAILFIVWLPWFELFKQAASIRSASFYIERASNWWWPFWALIVRIPFNWIYFIAGKKVVAYAIPLYLIAGLFIIMAATATKNVMVNLKGKQESNISSLLFIWLWAILPAALMWLIDVYEGHRVVEISRYLVATAPAVYILAGIGLATLTNRKVLLASILTSYITFSLINNAYAHMVPQREPWREMATLIDHIVPKDDLLLVSQYYDIVCLDRYLTTPHIQIGVGVSAGPEHLKQVIAGHKHFWLLTAQEGEAIKNMVPSQFKLNKQIDLFHALHLRLYKED